jgi:hypothetical protein
MNHDTTDSTGTPFPVYHLRRFLNETTVGTVATIAEVDAGTMHNTTTTTTDDDPVTFIEVVYYIMAATMIAVCLVCSRSRIPNEQYIQQATERRRQWLQTQQQQHRMMNNPQYRMQLILRGLVLRRITSYYYQYHPWSQQDKVNTNLHNTTNHQDQSRTTTTTVHLVLGNVHDSPIDGRSLVSMEEEEDHTNENEDTTTDNEEEAAHQEDEENGTSVCAICLEAFRPGDIVGISRSAAVWNNHNSNHPPPPCPLRHPRELEEDYDQPEQQDDQQDKVCNHAFHKDCIIPWLMRPTNDSCPSCRTVIVQETKEDIEQANAMMEKGEPIRLCSSSSYYDTTTRMDNDVEAAGGRYYYHHHPTTPTTLSSSVLVITHHGLVTRINQQDVVGGFDGSPITMLGQSISVLKQQETEKLELTPPETPPSPFRRVYSLEGTTTTTTTTNQYSSSSSLHHSQPSSGSRGTNRKVDDHTNSTITPSSSSGIMLPLVLEEDGVTEQQLLPYTFRRVVSDFTGTQSKRPVMDGTSVTTTATAVASSSSFFPNNHSRRRQPVLLPFRPRRSTTVLPILQSSPTDRGGRGGEYLVPPEQLRRTDPLVHAEAALIPSPSHLDCSERSICSEEDEIRVTELPPSPLTLPTVNGKY